MNGSFAHFLISWKLRQGKRAHLERGAALFAFGVVQNMLMDTPKHFTSMGKILYNKNNKPRRGTTDEEGEYSYGQVCREAGQDRRDI